MSKPVCGYTRTMLEVFQEPIWQMRMACCRICEPRKSLYRAELICDRELHAEYYRGLREARALAEAIRP